MDRLKGLGWVKGCALVFTLIWWFAPELLLERRWLMLIPAGALWWACYQLEKKMDEQQHRIEYIRDRLRNLERQRYD